jgi:RND family efflux transporter MFP subunit
MDNQFPIARQAGLLICIYLLGMSCGSSNKPDEKVNLQLPAGQASTVTTGQAVLKTFEYLISSNGKIKSQYEHQFISEAGGRIKACYATTGKRVMADETLLQFETAPIQFRLQKATLAQYNATKEYESQLLGYEQLLKDKNPEQTAAIQKKLKISTGLAGAEHEIEEANYELGNATIKAPTNGILANVKVQQHQYATPGSELFLLYDPWHLLLDLKILEADAWLLKPGHTAQVSSIANPGKQYAAAVDAINPYVDENGMVSISLKIITPLQGATSAPSLFPGMNCMAVIKVPSKKSVVVPREAVVMRSGKAVVFTLENGKAIWNYVTTGGDNGKEIEVITGLEPGKKVITSNNLQLSHEAPVIERSTQTSQ